MELSEILKRQAGFTTNSGYHVRFNEAYQWVSIEPVTFKPGDDDSDTIYLQGQEASDFLAEVESLWVEVDCLYYETVLNATAAKYIESLI